MNGPLNEPDLHGADVNPPSPPPSFPSVAAIDLNMHTLLIVVRMPNGYWLLRAMTMATGCMVAVIAGIASSIVSVVRYKHEKVQAE